MEGRGFGDGFSVTRGQRYLAVEIVLGAVLQILKGVNMDTVYVVLGVVISFLFEHLWQILILVIGCVGLICLITLVIQVRVIIGQLVQLFDNSSLDSMARTLRSIESELADIKFALRLIEKQLTNIEIERDTTRVINKIIHEKRKQ